VVEAIAPILRHAAIIAVAPLFRHAIVLYCIYDAAAEELQRAHRSGSGGRVGAAAEELCGTTAVASGAGAALHGRSGGGGETEFEKKGEKNMGYRPHPGCL
jgi:hypothetical protein